MILGVFLGTLAIFGGSASPIVNGNQPSFIPTNRDQIPSPCEAYCAPGPLTPYFGPTRLKQPSVPISEVESLVIHPGIIPIKSSPDKGYDNNAPDFARHNSRIRMIDSTYRQVRNLPEVREAEALSKTTDTKGFGVQVQNPQTGETTTCLFAMNPKLVENHRQATESMKTLLQKLDTISEKQISTALLKIHKTLMAGIPLTHVGKYRKDVVIIFKDNEEDQDRSEQGIITLLKNRGATKGQIKIYRTEVVPKMASNQYDFTDEQKNVLSLIGYLAPDPSQIESLMKNYVKNLKNMAIQMKTCEDFDPIAFAAYAHQEIARIHPFEDGNGRMARLLMNSILREAGYQSVVFPSDKEYTTAVEGDFATHLRNTAIPLAERYFGPGQPCLDLLTC